MSFDQFWIAAGCPARPVLVSGTSNVISGEDIKCKSFYNLTLLSWGSMGEFDDVENHLLQIEYCLLHKHHKLYFTILFCAIRNI